MMFIGVTPYGHHPATANVYSTLVLDGIGPWYCLDRGWTSVTDDAGMCDYRRDLIPRLNMDTPWTSQGRTTYLSSIVHSTYTLIDPGPMFLTNGIFNVYTVLLSSLIGSSGTFTLLERAFELDVRIDETLLEAISHEPEFLQIVTDILETNVKGLREWDGKATFSLCSFSDPDASGRETLQFVVHYSDDIPWDEMIEKWDSIAEDLVSIIPNEEMRKRTVVTFEPGP